MYITAADVQARTSANSFKLLFDRDGTGAVDSAFVSSCIAEAQSEWDMRVGADFPMNMDANGAVVDERIKGALVAMAMHCAERYTPLATNANTSPFRSAYLDALDLADRLRKDDGARLKTGAGGRALPIAATGNLRDQFGKPTDPFGRVADRRDPSGF